MPNPNYYEQLNDDSLIKTAVSFLSTNQSIPDQLMQVMAARGFDDLFYSEADDDEAAV